MHMNSKRKILLLARSGWVECNVGFVNVMFSLAFVLCFTFNVFYGYLVNMLVEHWRRRFWVRAHSSKSPDWQQISIIIWSVNSSILPRYVVSPFFAKKFRSYHIFKFESLKTRYIFSFSTFNFFLWICQASFFSFIFRPLKVIIEKIHTHKILPYIMCHFHCTCWQELQQIVIKHKIKKRKKGNYRSTCSVDAAVVARQWCLTQGKKS